MASLLFTIQYILLLLTPHHLQRFRLESKGSLNHGPRINIALIKLYPII